MFRTASRVANLVRKAARPVILVKARVPASPLKARLGLEQFEAREVPATFLWQGGVPGAPTSALVPANWQSPDAQGQLPGAGDAVLFSTPLNTNPGVDGEPPPPATIYDCVGLVIAGRTSPADQFAALVVSAGYTQTVTFGEALATGAFTLAGGAISQPAAGTDLTVTDTFTWTAGTLNSSANLATVTLSGASGLIAPGADNTISTGSHLTLLPRNGIAGLVGSVATFVDGTISFANAAGLVIDNLSTFNVGANQPQQQRPRLRVLFEGPNPFNDPAGVKVNTGGGLAILQGDFESNAPLYIEGGRLAVVGSDSTAKFAGRVNAVGNNGPSIQLNDGAIQLMQGTTLTAVNGITLSKGNGQTSSASLSTLWNPNFAGANQNQPDAKIVGNLVNNGADVGMCSDYTSRLKFAKLFIDGAVVWSGGTYKPLTYAPGGNVNWSDSWYSSGQFTINNGAQLAPAAVDANGTLNAQQPAVGEQWIIIASRDRIINNKTPPIAGKWKAVLEVDAGTNIVTRLRIEGIA